ncbi:restriction endonuclease subunit S [Echinimonas agarilytica]|uniref:Restriction endonuclease subunit S n=1 Tax=Echinimonas agarilytica TaxID=1215918 RepID=A0AA41W998_9GAMM|nr:restriction endonuclease subunit S [Echinimonas agarilytica]MCM2680957.1 restriction endonuclease subunit S [Echinimonas agarilytica]
MSRFEPTNLGEFCTVNSGFAFKSEQFSEDSNDTFLVKGSNLGHRVIRWDEGPWWDNSDYEKLQRYQLIVDDVVLAMDRPIVGGQLKFAWIKSSDPKSLLVQRVACLRAKDVGDQVFLRYVIASPAFLQYIDTITTGVNVPHISGPDIRKYIFNLPIPEDRQKIAVVLSAYDDLIDNNLERIKLLEEMAQITYEEWFVRMKFPGHEEIGIDSESGLPIGWKSQTLREVTSYINRGVAPKYVESDGFPVINQKCIRKHLVNFAESRLTASEHKVPKDKLLQPLDILVNSTGTGTLGRVAQFFDCSDRATVDTHVTIVRPSDEVSAYWLGRSLEAIEPFIVNLGKGATNQQELGRNDLADVVKLNTPTVELMTQFDDFAHPIFETITNLLNQNGLLKEARDLLLPRLMTGMIDIDNVELPEALLERINKQNHNETNIG